MDVIKQYEDYIGLKKEYIKNPTLENKNAMIAKLEEYGKYIYDQCNRLKKDCIVEEEKEVLRRYFGGKQQKGVEQSALFKMVQKFV